MVARIGLSMRTRVGLIGIVLVGLVTAAGCWSRFLALGGWVHVGRYVRGPRLMFLDHLRVGADRVPRYGSRGAGPTGTTGLTLHVGDALSRGGLPM